MWLFFFRHKDWRRCATSIISFSIMARLHTLTDGQIQKFFAYGRNGVPNWYKHYLIDWRDYDSMSRVFKMFFNNNGIAYTKLTHTRKLGIIRAHQLGADRENIILLSKHTTHRVDTSYLPELPYKAMLACAGFDVFRREEYFIPRSYITVPVGWINILFPQLELWKNQVNNLLDYDLLPFFATIIIQDGIYFTEKYPDHPFCKLLLYKLRGEGYEQWSEQMRTAVREKEVVVEENVREDRKYEAVLRTAEKAVQQMLIMQQQINELSAALLNKNSTSSDDIPTTF
jgi:hypothetical protein